MLYPRRRVDPLKLFEIFLPPKLPPVNDIAADILRLPLIDEIFAYFFSERFSKANLSI